MALYKLIDRIDRSCEREVTLAIVMLANADYFEFDAQIPAANTLGEVVQSNSDEHQRTDWKGISVAEQHQDLCLLRDRVYRRHRLSESTGMLYIGHVYM